MNITNEKEKISKICQKYNVKNLAIFGSVISDNFTDDSDVDFLVKFLDNKVAGSFDRYFGLKEELESLFGREVDLVCENRIKNPYFKKSVDSTKQIIYLA